MGRLGQFRLTYGTGRLGQFHPKLYGTGRLGQIHPTLYGTSRLGHFHPTLYGTGRIRAVSSNIVWDGQIREVLSKIVWDGQIREVLSNIVWDRQIREVLSKIVWDMGRILFKFYILYGVYRVREVDENYWKRVIFKAGFMLVASIGIWIWGSVRVYWDHYWGGGGGL